MEQKYKILPDLDNTRNTIKEQVSGWISYKHIIFSTDIFRQEFF